VGRQFEHLQSATQRLQIVVPVALLLVFAAVRDVRQRQGWPAGVHRHSVRADGGIVALWLRDIPLSISAGRLHRAVGRGGAQRLVMISFIRNLRERAPWTRRSTRALTRAAPVLMTALVASLGFVPMAMATGTGAEVQRPLATVVIGGILSSTALTLLVLPLLYRLVNEKEATA
jgi:cobalt-zinc-cadmium resistance protein CzcA